MAGSPHRVVDELGEAPVHVAALPVGGARVDVRCEQRVREADLAAGDLDDVAGRRCERRGAGAGAGRDRDRGGAKSGDDEQGRLGGCGKVCEAGVERRVHPERHRRVHFRVGARELDGHEGVAAGELVQADDGGSGESPARPRGHHSADRVHGQRPEVDARDGTRRVLDGRGDVAAREEQPDVGTVEAPKRERERIRGCGIEPVGIIDREHERPLRGKEPERCRDGHRDGAWVRRRLAGVVEQKRHPERVLLRPGQARKHIVPHRLEEVAERRLCEPEFALGGPGLQHAVSAFAGLAGGSSQERRLADAGFALEHERGRTMGLALAAQVALDRRDLLVASEDFGFHRDAMVT